MIILAHEHDYHLPLRCMVRYARFQSRSNCPAFAAATPICILKPSASECLPQNIPPHGRIFLPLPPTSPHLLSHSISFLGIYQGFFEKSPKATIRSTFPHIPKIKQIDTAHSKTSIKKAKTGAENRRFTGKY